jgi:hypothetical protein
MERGFLGASLVASHEDGKVLGIALGYGHKAEHEWGIDGLKWAFGLKDGIVHRVPARLRFGACGAYAYLGYTPDLAVFRDQGARMERYLRDPDPNERFVSVWDDKGFVVRTRGDGEHTLYQLYHALWRHDGFIGLTRPNQGLQQPFPDHTNVLHILIRSRMPCNMTAADMVQPKVAA